MLLWSALAVLASAGTAHAQAPLNLGGAASFAVLGGTAVSSTGSSVVNGDLGIGPGASLGGFPPGTVKGSVHVNDSVAALAQFSASAAYGDAAGRPATATLPTQLGGSTVSPGVYDSNSGRFDVGGPLTLDAQRDGNAVFIFKVATTLDVAAAAGQVVLIRSAQACNVFWHVAGTATLGAVSTFRGSVLAAGDITAGSGAAVEGRLLSQNGRVALAGGTVTAPLCDQSRPRLKIKQVPKGCASSFKARFRVSDGMGVTTAVFLDGKRIKRSSKRRFTAKIGANNLRTGRHALRASARDDSGNRRVAVSRFRSC